MTRVSENSGTNIFNYNLNKIKSKVEDLQLKGSTLKKIRKPSDNPLANIEALNITARTKDNEQFLKNSSLATMYLNATEDSLIQLTDILTKAKELAIQQSSDFYGADIRKNVANEILQLRTHALAIGNKRIGNRHIFGGYSTLTTPFNEAGKYQGDNGHITTEIAKDFFVPINLTGEEIFYFDDQTGSLQVDPLDEFPLFENSRNKILRENDPKELNENQKFIQKGRDLANLKDGGERENKLQQRENIFALLSMFASSLENNQSKSIQGLLEKMDSAISRIITMRTRVGSIARNVESTIESLETETINDKERRSHLVDADIAELFADITKQNDILKTAYQAGKVTLSKSLLDFIR